MPPSKSEVAVAGPLSLDQLTLHYQPQVTSSESRIVAVEALLRVRDPRPGLSGAVDILRCFAKPDDADALDWWVLRTACTDSKRWPGLSVAINVGVNQFRKPDFAARLIALIGDVGIDPRRIEIEIVEGVYIGDFDAALGNINELRAHGICIALDDFGTGYSSLSYLLKLPIDKLKIDKSFIDKIGSIQSAVIIQSIIALARALGLKTTAEGVETKEQWQFLRAAGCSLMQGWLFSKAEPAEEISCRVGCADGTALAQAGALPTPVRLVQSSTG